MQNLADDVNSQEHESSGHDADSQVAHVRSSARQQHGDAIPHAPAINPELPDGPAGASQAEGDIASTLRITHEADKKKGRAVSRQIVSSSPLTRAAAFSFPAVIITIQTLWDALLDTRIQLQKAITAANSLPLASSPLLLFLCGDFSPYAFLLAAR